MRVIAHDKFPRVAEKGCPAAASSALVRAEECGRGRGTAHTYRAHLPSPGAPHRKLLAASAKAGPGRAGLLALGEKGDPRQTLAEDLEEEGETCGGRPPSPRRLLAGGGRARRWAPRAAVLDAAR